MTCIDAGGRLQIADARGEVFGYALAPAEPWPDEWACTVTRLDSGSAYRVAYWPGTHSGPGDSHPGWHCSCEARTYKAGPRAPSCKHIAAVAPLRALLDLYRRRDDVKQSDKIDQLAAALVQAQNEIAMPAMDSEADTGKYRYRYASLAVVRQAVLPVLNKYGLALIQSPGAGERGATLTTTLIHKSGQWLQPEPCGMPVAKQDAQSYGSAITYARRYALLAILGVVADEDDDGAEACQPAPEEAAPAKQEATREQLGLIDKLVRELGISARDYSRALEARGCEFPAELSREQAAGMIGGLEKRRAATAANGGQR